MSKLFDEDYYQTKDTTKPVFSDSDDDLISEYLVFTTVVFITIEVAYNI